MGYKSRLGTAIVVVGVTVLTGTASVYAAINVFLSMQAESGMRATNSALVADTSASGGSVVIFGDSGPAQMMGWEINDTNVGLAPFGLSCASLPLYTGSMMPAAGTVISQKRIVGEFNASAGDIIIEKSCLQPASNSGSLKGILNTQICGANDCWTPNDGTVVRDSEIDGSLMTAQATAGTCAMVGLATLERNYIHGMGSGICYFGTGADGSAEAVNNYVTGLRSYGDSHNEAGTVRDFVKNAGDTRTVKFIGNRMFCDGNVTATIFLQPTWEDIYNVWVTDNYLEGGGYNLYSSGGQTGAHIGNAHATNNRFRATGWGPAVVDNVEGWVEWSQNYRYDAAQPNGKGVAVPQP